MIDKNYISNLDSKTYLNLLKDIKYYFMDYYLETKKIGFKSIEILSIIYVEDSNIFYILLNIYSFVDYNVFPVTSEDAIKGNITMEMNDFEIFLRYIKIKKIKNHE